MHQILNLGSSSTRVSCIGRAGRWILFDVGYPGSFGRLRAELQRRDIALNRIGAAMVSHFHIDHAGCAQDLKLAGVPLLVLPTQHDSIAPMARWTKPADRYTPITLHDNRRISFDGSRGVLAELGIAGQLLPTPGHSDDSISLLLDDGTALIGDLLPPQLVFGRERQQTIASFRHLIDAGARHFLPAHLEPFDRTRIEVTDDQPVWSTDD
jgi:ribonuclease/clavin/mitogillin